MHRSPLAVLVLSAAMAACSTHDSSDESALLSQDRTLVARLETDRESRRLPLPEACGTVSLAAQPSLANQQQAEELTRQAQDAEIHGDIREAHTLLGRASALDGTNKSAAYHLGRTSEALGDSTAAMTAFCRYLALTPTTAESLEARERVTKLADAHVHVSGGAVGASNTLAQRAPVVTPTPRVMASASRTRSISRVGRTRQVGSSNSAIEAPASSESPAQTREAAGTTQSGGTNGDVVATTRSEPVVDQPAAPTTVRRGPSRTQGAVIGVATGAIIGAAAGRSVRSAVIGAAAGGLLGTVVTNRVRPVDRGMRR